MASFRMMQGDSGAVYVTLKVQDSGEVITPSMVSEVEICIGNALRKTYRAGEVQYDVSKNQWYFILTQEETFRMAPGGYNVQVRPKFNNGQYSSVKGLSVGYIGILAANSKEVI